MARERDEHDAHRGFLGSGEQGDPERSVHDEPVFQTSRGCWGSWSFR